MSYTHRALPHADIMIHDDVYLSSKISATCSRGVTRHVTRPPAPIH
jgi:hypothetical protein